jgi:DNA-binding transcriptional LysR family regulator
MAPRQYCDCRCPGFTSEIYSLVGENASSVSGPSWLNNAETSTLTLQMKFCLPPLNTLRLFEAAGRHLNFKSAAQELGVTPSAVSHGIQALEDWLGSALFHRNGRAITLTSAGDAYLPAVAEALALLARAADHANGPNAGNALHISAAPTFASRILLPGLPRFRERHPLITVSLDTNQKVVEFPRGGADLAIRRGHGYWQGLSAELLLTERFVPVCAPRLLERLGETATLRSAPLIHVLGVSEDWQTWADACGEGEVDCGKGLKVDTIEMAIEAAVGGLGIAIGRRPFIEAELASGTLVLFCDREIPAAAGYWLAAPPDTMNRPDVRAFRDWLFDELQPFRGPNDCAEGTPGFASPRNRAEEPR